MRIWFLQIKEHPLGIYGEMLRALNSSPTEGGLLWWWHKFLKWFIALSPGQEMKNWKEEVAIDGIDELEKGTIWESRIQKIR